MRAIRAVLLTILAITASSAHAQQSRWVHEWPATDFEHSLVDLAEIRDGGPPKDGFPAIDHPRFQPVAEIDDLADAEPVIGLTVSGESRAYPLRVLTWHEIANAEIGGVPVVLGFVEQDLLGPCRLVEFRSIDVDGRPPSLLERGVGAERGVRPAS